MTLRLTLALSILLFLLACSSPTTHPTEAAADFKSYHAALPFAGAWVNEIYVDSIRKNRSPRNDQEIDEGCIHIPDSTLKTTSMIYGFHEGGPTILVVKVGDRFQFYDPDFKTPGDTIELITPDRLRIGRHYFHKLQHPDMEKSEWGILNELLFSGKYQASDGRIVVFGTDGHIQGLDTLTYYQPYADYTGDYDLGVDRFSLGQNAKKMTEYGYQFDRDTLLIYPIDCLHYDTIAQECSSEQLGEAKWKLLKLR